MLQCDCVHLAERQALFFSGSNTDVENISQVSACISCHDGYDNAAGSDWSAAVMAWLVSLVCGRLRAHHIDCV